MAKVLIIDDDRQLCEMLLLKVGTLDHQSEHAQSLARGLALAGGVAHDVVFLDVRLPDGNGLEIVKDLRESPGRPEAVALVQRHGLAPVFEWLWSNATGWRQSSSGSACTTAASPHPGGSS